MNCSGTVFDIESNGLHAATKVHCIVVIELNSDRVEEFGPDQIEAGLARLSQARRLIGQNIIDFDLPLLQRLYGWTPAAGCVVADTLVAARLFLPHILDLDAQAARMGDPSLGEHTGSHSLEAWGGRLGSPKIGADIENFSEWSPELQARCVGDTRLAKQLWEFLQPDGQPQEALALEHRVAPICGEITAAGMPFNIAAAERRRQQWTARRKERETALRAQFPEVKSWNSRTQVGACLVAQGWKPEEFTEKKKQPRLTDDVLEELPKLFPEFTGIAEYWTLGKRLGQLANGKKAWLKHVGADGRIHGRIKHIGTPQSRASHSDPNMGQIPNPKKGKPFAAECRSLFRIDNGWVFVSCDQAGLQDRGFAHYLAEFDGGAYAKAFLAGLDTHWKTAQALGFVAPETPRDKESQLHVVIREGSKPFRFGFLFGMRDKRAGSIVRNIINAVMRIDPHCTLMRAFFGTDTPNVASIKAAGAKAINKFIAATPGLGELRQSLEMQVNKYHWILGLDGRRVPVDSAHKALNFALTSAEAIICKHWLVQVRNELGQRFAYGWNGDVVLVGWVHDELIACCRPEVANEVGEIMKRCAKEAGEYYKFRCALDADYTIGRSWAGDIVEAEPPPTTPVQPGLNGAAGATAVGCAEVVQPDLEDASAPQAAVDVAEVAQPDIGDTSAATGDAAELVPTGKPVQPGHEDPSPAAKTVPPSFEAASTIAAVDAEVAQPATAIDGAEAVQAAAVGAATGNGTAADPWWCAPIAIEELYWISLAGEDAPPPASCLNAALQWAGRGCAVFPVPPGTKKSCKAGKQNGGARWGATSDPVEIERDWQRWPNANIGLPTDATNGFWVLEADTREGHPKLGDQDGLDTLAAFEREFGPLPNTLCAESPSGSQHRYFRHPAGAPVRSKAGWRHGIDIKGEGGMVIAPPSRRGDKAYRWVNQLPIAEAPEWLLGLIQDSYEHAPNDTNGFSDTLLDEMAANAEQGVWEEEEKTPAEKLRIALAVIPPTSREERINFGRALYRWSNGSEDGLALFAEWLRLRDGDGKHWWPDYAKADMHRVWRSYKEAEPPKQKITIASIFGRANELDPAWYDRWIEAEYEATEARCAQAAEEQARAAKGETTSAGAAGEASEGIDGLGSKGAGNDTGNGTTGKSGNGENKQDSNGPQAASEKAGSDEHGGDGLHGGNGHGGNGHGGNGHGGNGDSSGSQPFPGSKPDPGNDDWPKLHPDALYGLAGDVVRAIEPHTESDPVALLIQQIVYFGNVIGRGPYYQIEDDRHYTNLFCTLAGESAEARKGTSAGRIRALCTRVDSDWSINCVEYGGLASGEGIIRRVRDRHEGVDKKGNPVIDEGVPDKRLLIDEGEFGGALAVMKRPGNTLSPIIRNAWDGRPLRNLTKNSPERCLEPHVSFIAHITDHELRELLDHTSLLNGFANRFLFARVQRSKLLPDGGMMLDEVTKDRLSGKLRSALETARGIGRVTMAPDTAEMWATAYRRMARRPPGLYGAACKRGDCQTIRLSMLYALLNETAIIAPVHLRAGLALWEFCEQSAKGIFGDLLGEPMADEILIALRRVGAAGLSRTDISVLFRHHKPSHIIAQALQRLLTNGKVRWEPRRGPRGVETWFAV
jgi:DNA polymerase I-like protein with 3'-5' exonuclease and polymerase domains